MTRATEAARELLDVNVPRVLRRAGALGRGAGVVDAVAMLVEPHPVAVGLRRGASLAMRDPKAALEAAAATLDVAETHVRPSLPRSKRSLTFTVRAGSMNDPANQIRHIDEKVRAMARWLAPMALGMSPAEYARLTDPMPRVIRSLGPGEPSFIWTENATPDSVTARRTLELLAFTVLRLWLSDLLVYPEDLHRPPVE